MFLVTQFLQATFALIELVLAALVDAAPAAIFDITSTIHVYTDGPAPGPGNILTDFTEATFTGSAAKTLAAVTGPINLPGGQGMQATFTWTCTAAPTPAQEIKGVYIVAANGTTLLAVEQFVTPVSIRNVSDFLDYTLLVAPKSRWGGQLSAQL